MLKAVVRLSLKNVLQTTETRAPNLEHTLTDSNVQAVEVSWTHMQSEVAAK